MKEIKQYNLLNENIIDIFSEKGDIIRTENIPDGSECIYNAEFTLRFYKNRVNKRTKKFEIKKVQLIVKEKEIESELIYKCKKEIKNDSGKKLTEDQFESCIIEIINIQPLMYLSYTN